MEEKVFASNVLEVWATKFSEVQQWLPHVQRKEQSALNLYKFCGWCHKIPTELLAIKAKDPSANIVEKLLDDFCGSATGFTNAQKYNISIAVKSFFKWNYQDLAKASGAVSLEQVKPYHKLSKEGLRKLWFTALNPRDRALITFTTSTGIAKETLTNLLWSHLEEGWEAKDLPCITIASELLKGHGRGKYRGVKQVTFLTGEAKRDLLNYKEWLERKLGRELRPEDHMWLETCRPYRPLGYDSFGNLIVILSRNAGVPFSWHDARRWVNTALEQIGISQNWARKIRGRKVKGEEAPYSQPAIDQLRAKFAEAVPLLEFTSERPQLDLEKRAQVSERIFGKMLSGEQLDDQDRRDIKLYNIQLRTHSKQKPDDCADGEHCQKIVSEENLGEFLSRGFRVVATLPSGKIVIDDR